MWSYLLEPVTCVAAAVCTSCRTLGWWSESDLASQSFFSAFHQAESSRDGQRGEQTSVSVGPSSSQHQLRELLETWSKLWQTPGEFRTQSQNETSLNTSQSHMYTFKSTRSFTYFNIVTFFDQSSFSRSSFSLAQGAQSCCLRFDLSLDQFECIFVSGRQSWRLCYAVQNLGLFTTVRLCC